MWEVRKGNRRTVLHNYRTECDPPAVLHLAGDKLACHRIATSVGVPVPPHVAFTASDLTPACRFLEDQHHPCVVKPASGTASGMGVTTGVRTRAELRSAAALASLYHDSLMIEAMAVGETCRLLYLGGRFIHAVRRRGVRVTGDGATTVVQLLHTAGLQAVARDPMAALTLAAAGLTLHSVPAAGASVLVRGVPAVPRATTELRTIYDQTVTRECAPALVNQVAKVVQAIGSGFAGVDIVATSLATQLGGSVGTLLELNTTPGIHHHYVTPDDHAHPIATRVLAHLLGIEDPLGGT